MKLHWKRIMIGFVLVTLIFVIGVIGYLYYWRESHRDQWARDKELMDQRYYQEVQRFPGYDITFTLGDNGSGQMGIITMTPSVTPAFSESQTPTPVTTISSVTK